MQPDPANSRKINSANGQSSYGFGSSMIRASMEDFYEPRIDDIYGEKVGMVGVYDGHGGVRAAEDFLGFVVQINRTGLAMYPLQISNSEYGAFSYGFLSSMIRASMEDFYEARIYDIYGKKVGMFGVYDGHGGVRAAEDFPGFDVLINRTGLGMYPLQISNSENGRFSYGFVSSMKRASMEDFYEPRIDDIYGEKVGMFGVYDGHRGVRAAEYVKQHLFSNLIKHPKFITDTRAAIAKTYNLTDSEFLKADSHQTRDAGSTASTAIIVGDRLLVANVGDSRAIISKGGQAIVVSRDHKPDQIDERQRIEDAGGFVMWAGTWRVGRVLAVSRGFGDKILKQYVVADPEINFVLHSTNTKRNHVRKDIFMLSRARNGGSSSEGIGFTLSGGNNHYRETDSAYNDMPEVILDNQAQVNCTGNFNVLSNLSIGPVNVVLIAANGREMETFMSGSVHMGNFSLPDVHYCPDLGNRVIVSGSILDNDDYGYEFGRGKFTVKDLKNDTTVGEGRLVDGNYILEYLKISGDRTRVPQQPGLVTTVWNAICSALHRVGLNPQGPPM